MKLSKPECLGGSWQVWPGFIESGFAAYAQCWTDRLEVNVRLQPFGGLAAAFAVFLAPCSVSSGQLSEADRTAIKTVHEAFEAALLSNDMDAAFALYAADAVQLVPGQPPVRGRPAILRRAKELMSDLTFVEREHKIEAIDGREDLAYVWGIIAQKVTLQGQVTAGGVKMLRILRKQPDGPWLVVLDIWNYD